MTGAGGNTDRAADPRDCLKKWADRYEYGYAGGFWLAIRLDADNTAEPLFAQTPEGLAEAIEADDRATRGAP